MTYLTRETRTNLSSMLRSPIFQLLVLITLFAAAIELVGIHGEFPLNDDWSFARVTRTLAASGNWEPLGWTSMSLITNALWAWPVCIASGCNFADLRITTLLASVALFLTTFFLVKMSKKKETELPIVASLLVAFNPISFALSFTFMTDILFSALVTISALLFLVALNRESYLFVILGTIVAIAATLSRQVGLCIPVAHLAVRLLQSGGRRSNLVLGLAPLILCAASLTLYEGWLHEANKLPANYYLKFGIIASSSPIEIAELALANLITALLYLGLFTLPVLIITSREAVIAEANRFYRMAPMFIAVGLTVLGMLMMHLLGKIMPVKGNILVPEGIGPLTLRDTYLLHLPNVPALPTAFWAVVTICSFMGMFEIVVRVTTYLINTLMTQRIGYFQQSEIPAVFTMIAIFAYLSVIVILHTFDRYFIPILPLTLFFLTRVSAEGFVSRNRLITAFAFCSALATFSVLGVHDYMAWNRARWSAISDLMKKGIASPANLDGGFEYNGFFSYNPSYVREAGKSYWWVEKDDYLIAFNPIEGRKVIRSYPYETLLPVANRAIVVLKK